MVSYHLAVCAAGHGRWFQWCDPRLDDHPKDGEEWGWRDHDAGVSAAWLCALDEFLFLQLALNRSFGGSTGSILRYFEYSDFSYSAPPWTNPRKWNPQHAKVVKKEPAEETGAGTAHHPVIVLAQEKKLNSFDLPHACDHTQGLTRRIILVNHGTNG